ncbi:MAG: hypothetical protein J7K71_04935 [Candidatus Omnitrophica bacterium]|nr:hypothetical protein [Candidatus Omnitrophota bacterium]
MRFRSNKLRRVYRSEPYMVQRIEKYLVLPVCLWWRDAFGEWMLWCILLKEFLQDEYQLKLT